MMVSKNNLKILSAPDQKADPKQPEADGLHVGAKPVSLPKTMPMNVGK